MIREKEEARACLTEKLPLQLSLIIRSFTATPKIPLNFFYRRHDLYNDQKKGNKNPTRHHPVLILLSVSRFKFEKWEFQQRYAWVNKRKSFLIPSPAEEQRIRNAKQSTQGTDCLWKRTYNS